MNLDQIKIYVEERDAALNSLDLETWRRFAIKWTRLGVLAGPVPEDKVLEIAMYKCALNSAGTTKATKAAAKRWLFARGYTLKIF